MSAAPEPFDHDTVVLLECNLDDAPGQVLGYVLETLMERGALDVWFTPIYMKKNRPGTKLSVLARPQDVERLVRMVMEETTTLGVRQVPVQRWKAQRDWVSVETPWGPVRVKVKRLGDRVLDAWPEYEDCVEVARAAEVPLAQVQRVAREAAWGELAKATKDERRMTDGE
jgi:uncharacterized protein (DUF111 family)